MRDNCLRVEIAQQTLGDLRCGKHTGMPHTKASNLVLSNPFVQQIESRLAHKTLRTAERVGPLSTVSIIINKSLYLSYIGEVQAYL